MANRGQSTVRADPLAAFGAASVRSDSGNSRSPYPWRPETPAISSFGSSGLRLNWTFESMMSVAQAAMILTFWPSSFLDLILQLANFPLRRPPR